MIFTAGFFQLTGSFDNFLFSCTLVRQYRPLPARTGRKQRLSDLHMEADVSPCCHL